MRYQKFANDKTAGDTPVAAVWPSFEEALLNRPPLGREEDEAAIVSPAPAAPDVPASVGGLIAASYAGLMAVFFVFFTGSPLAFFCVAISAFFVAVYLTVPRIFFAVEADPAQRPSLSRFWHEGMQTQTGRSSGRDAMIQMMIVPVFLTFGLLVMGIFAKIYIG